MILMESEEEKEFPPKKKKYDWRVTCASALALGQGICNGAGKLTWSQSGVGAGV